eukprot:3877338-Pyramimonas_sp.AAC.1
MEPRNNVVSVADACDRLLWGLGWGSPWGHEALYWVWRPRVATLTGAQVDFPTGPRSAVLGVADARGHPQWGLGWNSP